MSQTRTYLLAFEPEATQVLVELLDRTPPESPVTVRDLIKALPSSGSKTLFTKIDESKVQCYRARGCKVFEVQTWNCSKTGKSMNSVVPLAA